MNPTPKQLASIIHEKITSQKLSVETSNVDYLIEALGRIYCYTPEQKAETWGHLEERGYTPPRDPSAEDGTDGRHYVCIITPFQR